MTAGDDGWAVNEDRRLTIAALDGIVEFVDRPADAEVIHACWWDPLMALPQQAVEGKHVICHMVGDPARVMTEPAFLPSLQRVNTWVAQSRGALAKLRLLADTVEFVPYAVDVGAFASPEHEPSAAVRKALDAIPAGRYVISSFHRDTAGAWYGPGMETPKLVKGPDLLLAILTELHRRGVPVTALLAGPRRHWVRDRLRAAGVHTVFAGDEMAGEDYPANILGRSDVAHLLHASHLALTTSRSEGGPRSILEAAAAGVAQLSTPVGHATEVLHHDSIFTDVVDAADRIVRDVADGSQRALAPAAHSIVKAVHTAQANHGLWAGIYSRLKRGGGPMPRGAFATAWLERPEHRAGAKPVPPVAARCPRVAFWNKFTPPPWGGGNQFMMALMLEARRQGVDAVPNAEGGAGGCDGHIVNSVQFDIERFTAEVEPGSAPVLHRIDGPISVLRGTPESLESDRECFRINARWATATVIQSWHTLRALNELGFAPVNPALVTNAPDPSVFHPPHGEFTEPPREGKPLLVVATAWSSNPSKGARVFEWLDRNLDPAHHELVFVGNTAARFERARLVPAMPSLGLADLLRTQHVYLAASRNDPCSNALIEALSCGLPAVYLDSGGHAEIVGHAGLPFTHPREVPELLDRIRANLGFYRTLIRLPSIEEICKRYLELLWARR